MLLQVLDHGINSECVAGLCVSVTSRRGSNASLTLDLQASPEMGRWDGTPPKERCVSLKYSFAREHPLLL